MSLRTVTPRLLPTTIFTLAALLTVKSVELVKAAVPSGQAEPTANPASPAGPVAHAPAEQRPGAPAEQASGAKSVAPAPEPAPVSDSERALLLDLRQRRQELESREAALSAREAVLSAAEQKLSARVGELQALQSRLEALESARKSHEEANWRGLVKLYESMKPRDAAAIFDDLDMPVLLQVVDRMKEAKAAAVLAAMQPEKARQVTAELAQMRLRATSESGPQKGG